MSRKSERDAERAAWLKQAGDLVPDRFRGPDEWRVLTWLRDLEAEVTRLKKQLEYGDVTPASAVAAEVAVLRENNEALGLKVNELEAEAAAMREALECIRNHHTYEDWRVAQDMADAALASDAGKAMLDWKESALRVMTEWHDAREVIGGAQLGDGPMEWAHRVKERLEKAAAQVAIGFQPMGHPDDCRCDDLCEQVTDIAAAIRAKAKEGT